MRAVVARPGMRMVVVRDDGAERRLLNWYKLDFFEWDEEQELTWGRDDIGSRRTAYAILREFLGKDAAMEFNLPFGRLCIARMPEGEGFTLTEKEVKRILEGIKSEMVVGDGQRRL